MLVAQEPVLYNGSIRDNILYGCDWATEEDMLEAAQKANVHDFVMELEKKYDTDCGDRGVQMSGEFDECRIVIPLSFFAHKSKLSGGVGQRCSLRSWFRLLALIQHMIISGHYRWKNLVLFNPLSPMTGRYNLLITVDALN